MSGWDVKQMLKLLVTSARIGNRRWAPEDAPPARPVQPAGSPARAVSASTRRWCATMPWRSSGLLVAQDRRPERQTVPAGRLLVASEFPDARVSGRSRRGLSIAAACTPTGSRTFLHPSLLAFDASTREECTVRAAAFNTPLQPLVLLNDPIYVEAARAFAEPDPPRGRRRLARRIEWVYRTVLSRKPLPGRGGPGRGPARQAPGEFRARPAAATELLHTGERPSPPTSTQPSWRRGHRWPGSC